MGLDELNAISEGVGREGPIKTLQWLGIVLHFAARGSQRSEKLREITYQECRMRFPRGAKVRLNAEVKLQRATSKPRTATSSEVRWFWQFDESEKLAIKSTRARLAANGYGQLNVIDAVNGHRGNSPNEPR